MARKPRILVAEDDAGIRELVRTRLDQAGYDTHIARNGLEAAERIRELRPDAVVLDINMPGLDGFGVLALMRQDGAFKDTRVLVLTARHAAEDVKRALSLGAKDYLTKPFSESQLIARVARLLRPPLPNPVEDNVVLI
jgi:two-component system OmpR family response regulator